MSNRMSLDGLFSPGTCWKIIAVIGYLHSLIIFFFLRRCLKNRPEHLMFLSWQKSTHWQCNDSLIAWFVISTRFACVLFEICLFTRCALSSFFSLARFILNAKHEHSKCPPADQWYLWADQCSYLAKAMGQSSPAGWKDPKCNVDSLDALF